MADIERGRIVWLTNVIDSQGNPTEDHRGIILTTNADYQAGKPIKAVMISSKLDYTTEDRMVKLKYLKRPSGHPQTGLNRPSAAICDWMQTVKEDDITSYGNLIFSERTGWCGSSAATAFSPLWLDVYGPATKNYFSPSFCDTAGTDGYTPCSMFVVAPKWSNCNPAVASSNHADGLPVAMGDGSCRTVAAGISQQTWQDACDPRDGNPLGADW